MNKIANTQSFSKLLIGWLVAYIFLSCLSLQYAYATNDSLEIKKKNLQHSLSITKEKKTQITILWELSLLTRQTPEEVDYLKQIWELSDEVDSIQFCYKAISSLGRYYSNDAQIDSISYYVEIMDSLANARNEMPDELFAIHNYRCRYYLIHGAYELAMNEAVNIQIEADKVNNIQGLIYCHENLGLIYMITKRYKKATQELESALSLLKENDDDLIYELQISENLVRSYLYLPDEYAKAEEAIDYCLDKLAKVQISNDIRSKKYPLEEGYFIFYSYLIQLYSLQGNIQGAKQAIQSITPYLEENKDGYQSQLHYMAMAQYYYAIKNYPMVIHTIKNGNINMINDAMNLEIQSLEALGQEDKALEIYKRLLERAKKVNLLAYTNQVDQIQSLQNSNEQEKQKQNELNHQSEINHKQHLFIVFILFSSLLLILLIGLYRYLIRMRHLRNALEKEKQILQETNEDLRLAKELADKANQMKSNFVANISHEIQTPLNAIERFTDKLEDSETGREHYIRIINNNSDLLLNLVSDVLDMNRLEEKEITTNLKESDITDCCQNAIDTIQHQVSSNVLLTYTHPECPLFISTDPLRLQQLLINLLINTTQATQQGEINLDYKVDTLSQQVLFTITDTRENTSLDNLEDDLGYNISHSIADSLCGSIMVDPSHTRGVRFIFKHPIK